MRPGFTAASFGTQPVPHPVACKNRRSTNVSPALMLLLRRIILLGTLALASARAGGIDFTRDIQPILSENCYHCHGPDAATREGGLRLDTRDGALRELDGSIAIKPGDSANSEVIRRLFSTDPDLVMPPPDSKREVTPAQKDLLKRWIDQGAEWADHWAYIAPRRAPLPPGADHPIDAFIQERLAKESLAPSPEAPKEKLLRRVTLDLTGLPPTPGEIDAFLADTAPDAYERAVDRLMASPRYGERMVWEWLDAARYADTNGYQGDPTRAMWYWRDWAIHALNANMPFDQFTIEQLAGDLLPEPTRDQLIATGFHRNHMLNGEGGRIPEETRVENVMDRTETTGTVWLGLTFQCSRCHDHKYDQLSHAEYFQFAAFFNSIDETGSNDAGGLAHPIFSFASPEQQQRIGELKAAELAASRNRDEIEATLRTRQSQWEESMSADADGGPTEVRWTPLVPLEANAEKGTQLAIAEDGSILARGESPTHEEYLILYPAKIDAITAFRLEVLPDDSLPHRGPGRAPENGNFVLSGITLQDYGKNIVLQAVEATFAQNGFGAEGVFDANPETGWAIQGGAGNAQTLIFTPQTSPRLGHGHNLAFRLQFAYGRQHTIGKFRLSATTDHPALLRPMPERIRELLAKPAGSRSDAEREEITRHYLGIQPELATATRERDAAKTAREAAERDIPKTMVMRERKEPRETFILLKGDYQSPGPKVEHGTPAFLPSPPADAPMNRLTLARWLVSRENPLTARVTVNRYWQQFFGTGIVKTPDDFGVQGDRPSHPELLDWLAVEFMESGWDMKHLVRLIVTSATYRQSSKFAAGMAERDPENRLLARGPRHRLPSWMLRDQALAVSGLLVETLGGPPVKGYQPDGVWEEATFGQIRYQRDNGEALHRRSLYTFWRRIIGPTMFFDVANRQTCSVKTGITNTPLHALVTLNDVTYSEAARLLATRMFREAAASDDARIRFAFRLCTSRQPDAGDMEILMRALGRLRSQFQADPAAAAKWIAHGETPPDPALDPVELAAHAALCSLILNLDETLSKE